MIKFNNFLVDDSIPGIGRGPDVGSRQSVGDYEPEDDKFKEPVSLRVALPGAVA